MNLCDNRQLVVTRKITDRYGVSVAKICNFFMFGVFSMRKTDARIRYTQRMLKESFLILLKQKPVNKITVKEVCEMAELNRATFYAHYSDCFALLESIEQELLEAFQKSLKLVECFDVAGLIEAVYALVGQREDACRVLSFQGASASVLQRMIDLARDESIAYWKQKLRHATDAELEMLYTHLSNGLMHVVVGGYDKYSREEVIYFVNRIVKSSLSLFQ